MVSKISLMDFSRNVMHSMRNFRGVLNKPVNRNFAATLIGVVAVVLPVYAFYDMDWGDAEFNAMSVLIPLLYVVFVAGFVFLALDKKGRNLTSVETDKKIAITYSSFKKNLLQYGGCWLLHGFFGLRISLWN